MKKPELILKKALLTALSALIVLFSYYFVEQATPTPLPETGVVPHLYSNQARDDLTSGYVGAIKNAKESVVMAIYTLTDKKVIEALKQQADRGVEVTLVTDGTTVPFIDRTVGKKIKTIKRFGAGIMHLKVMVIDGSQVWIGSANMTHESLAMHGNLVLAVDSPGLGSYITDKLLSLPEENRGPSFPYRSFSYGNQELELWFLPDNKMAVPKIKKMIDGAQKTLKVAMFTWTRMDFADAVFRAHKRGVDVEVVIDNNAGKGAGAKVVKFLKDRGINVKLSSSIGLLHHKMMIIDNETLVMGSANWTKKAFTDNDDCFIVLSNLTDEQKERLDALWKVVKNEARKP